MSCRVSVLRNRLADGISIRLRTFAGGRFTSYCRPTWISFLLTELCNARCVHCDIWKNRGREDSPTLEQWKAACRNLRDWLGPAHVCLTGGEALLKPFTVDLMEYASRIGLLVELLTHGYWDDQSKIERAALARPWRVTVSLDGLGETHTRIRRREHFFEKTSATIDTLRRTRQERHLNFSIRLKTVDMEHNLDDLCDLARFASQEGVDIVFQAVEQNYNTPEDPHWFRRSENWPRDVDKATAIVQELIALKGRGLHIANSRGELEVMAEYFRNPEALQVAIQGHTAHERQQLCNGWGLLQVHANGDVRICFRQPPVGNIKNSGLREIWENRPRLWEDGCCLAKSCSQPEADALVTLVK